MCRFYQVHPIALEDVIAKYTPRIKGREPTFSHIVLLSDVPIGKMQCYRNIDWPHYAADINLHDGVSIDYFIGEPSALGKGYRQGKEFLVNRSYHKSSDTMPELQCVVED